MSDFQSIYEFVQSNSEILIAICAVLLVILLVRKWPDIATLTFLRSGIRGGKNVEKYRQDLAENITNLGNRVRKASADQKIKIQAINLERERVRHLVKTNPQLVSEVGKALIAIEKEYQENLKGVKSNQGREILRLATEKRMNDLLQNLEIKATDIPAFHISDENQ